MIRWQQHSGFERLYNVVHHVLHLSTGSRSLLLIVLLAVQGMALGQILEPPSLRCVNVSVTGDVTITWVLPPDPGGILQEIRIYHSPVAGGPFALVGTVPPQLTYFHAGANANAGPRYYYVTAVSNAPSPNESAPSDTLNSIYLEVTQSAPLGSAVITWVAPVILPTSASDISVWMEYPLGNWTLVANVPVTATSYSHVISVCEDSLTFRVGLADMANCVSYSSRDGEIFEDSTPPSSPIMTTVSVDTLSGLANLFWDPSPQSDTDGYIILINLPGGAVIIDTIYGQFNTTYEWSWSTPWVGPESYTIAAFDTCQVGTPPSPNTSAALPPHTTMHLQTSYDRCESRIFLEWSPYGGWPVQSHQVLMQVDGGIWITLGNVAGTVTSFSLNVQPGRNYCFVVKASRGTGLATSLSQVACRFSEYPAVPAFNYIRTVTVTAPDEILVVDSVDMNAAVSRYVLERSDNGGPWEERAVAGGDEGPVIEFYDNGLDPSTIGYRYRVQVEDSCGSGSFTSNVGGSILLRAVPDLHNFNTLEWNGYADWAGTPSTYMITRSVDNGPFDTLAYAPPAPWRYVDNVHDLIETTGRFCYYVQARESANPSGINATSESNVACAVQEELVYIPNAFTVGGVNHEFKPVIGYVDIKDYELRIINRWGLVIWTTNDPDEGWNGTIGSQVMPTGVYAYNCSFHNGSGRKFEKNGTVTLLTAIGN